MKKFLIYVGLIAGVFSLAPMLAENVINADNMKYITQLDSLYEKHGKKKLLSVGIDYNLCLSVLENNEATSSIFLDCKTNIYGAKIKLYMGK